MKLVSYINENKSQIGALRDNYIIPFSNDPNIPQDMLTFIQNSEEFLHLARNLIEKK